MLITKFQLCSACLSSPSINTCIHISLDVCLCCIILIGARSTHRGSSTFYKLVAVHTITSQQLKRQAVLFVMCHAVERYSSCDDGKDLILRASCCRHRGQVHCFSIMDFLNMPSSCVACILIAFHNNIKINLRRSLNSSAKV